MKNTLLDVHNILMEQLERLSDEDLDDEQLEKEMKRSKSMTDLTKVIVDNSNTMLDAQKLATEYGKTRETMPKILIGNGDEDNDK